MRRIAVLTSGGDAPGMNACVRAVVRTGIRHGLAVSGVLRGFEGLIEGWFHELGYDDVSNIIQHGGTIIFTARSSRFKTPEGRAAAAARIREAGIDGLVVIGGDGSFRAADLLAEEHGIPVVGVPGTIDNDIRGTDCTIGYDTAVNTALQAIDRIKDTAAAHDRLFIVEVMGRRSGFIALEVGIGVGAEGIILPETDTDLEGIALLVRRRMEAGKRSSILVCAEGDEEGNASAIAGKLARGWGIQSHVTVLGHIQRGGAPTTADRVLATRLGWAAVNALLEGAHPCMVGEIDHHVVRSPLHDRRDLRKELDPELLRLSSLL
jgi:6-phosphofructokinase 1